MKTILSFLLVILGACIWASLWNRTPTISEALREEPAQSWPPTNQVAAITNESPVMMFYLPTNGVYQRWAQTNVFGVGLIVYEEWNVQAGVYIPKIAIEE